MGEGRLFAGRPSRADRRLALRRGGPQCPPFILGQPTWVTYPLIRLRGSCQRMLVSRNGAGFRIKSGMTSQAAGKPIIIGVLSGLGCPASAGETCKPLAYVT